MRNPYWLMEALLFAIACLLLCILVVGILIFLLLHGDLRTPLFFYAAGG